MNTGQPGKAAPVWTDRWRRNNFARTKKAVGEHVARFNDYTADNWNTSSNLAKAPVIW